MQATALHAALSPLPGAATRAGLPAEPADDVPDFGQELRAATGLADEIALPPPARTGSRATAPKTPSVASASENQQVAATARPGDAASITSGRGATVGPAQAHGTQASGERGSALSQAGSLKTPRSMQATPEDAPTVMARQVFGMPQHGTDPASGTPVQTSRGLPAGRLPGEPAPARLPDAPRDPTLASDTTGLITAPPTTGAATTTDGDAIELITARIPAEAGTVTLGRRSAVDGLDGTADPMQALPQRLLRLAEDGIESARIDLDIASTAPLEVRIARDADTVRVDLTSTDRQVRGRLEAALPAVAAALHAAGLKLADGGVHARPPQPGPDAASDLAGADAGLDRAVDAARSADRPATSDEAENAARQTGAQAGLDDVNARPEPQSRDDTAVPSVRDLPSRPVAIDERQTQTGPDRASQQAARQTVASGGEAGAAHPLAPMPGQADRGAVAHPAPARPEPESPAAAARLPTSGDTSSPTDGAAAQGPASKPKRVASREAVVPGDRRADHSPTEHPPAAQTTSLSASAGPAGSAWAQAVHPTDASVATTNAPGASTAAARSGLPLTAEARAVADRPASADASGRSRLQTPSGARPQPEGAAVRNAAAGSGSLDQERGGRTPAAPTAADQAGAQAMQTLQNLPAMQTFMAGMAEGRAPRTGPSVSATDGPRAVNRTATPRREPGPARAEVQATAAQMSPTAMMASVPPASPSSPGWGTAFEGATRALDAAAPSRQIDVDASALATGALPASTGEAGFASALELAGSALPEFMLRESLDSPEFAPALSARIATLVRDGVEEARIQLNPADMGPVAVQLAMEGSDVRVDLAAEVESTRQILEQALPSLASALRESGFTLTGGGVFQQPRDTSGGGQAPQEGHTGRAGTDPAGERVSTVSLAGTGRQAPRGLVDLYA